MMPWIKKNRPGRPVAQLIRSGSKPSGGRAGNRAALCFVPGVSSRPERSIRSGDDVDVAAPRRKRGIYILPNLFTLAALFWRVSTPS